MSLSLNSLRPACSPCMWGFLIPKLMTSRLSTTNFLCLLPLFLFGLLEAHLPAYLLPPFSSDPQDQARVPSSSILALRLCSYRPLCPPPFLARLVCWLPPTESTPHLTSIPITSSTTSSSSERTPAHPNLHLYPWNLSLTPGILLTHTACLVLPASWRTWLTCFSLTQGAQSRTFLFQRT